MENNFASQSTPFVTQQSSQQIPPFSEQHQPTGLNNVQSQLSWNVIGQALVQEKGMQRSQMGSRESLQNDMISNFFSTSGKNNHYSNLLSQQLSKKTSPQRSPVPMSMGPKSSKANQDLKSILKESKTWNLEEDDIDEFKVKEDNLFLYSPLKALGNIKFLAYNNNKLSSNHKKQSQLQKKKQNNQSQNHPLCKNSNSLLKPPTTDRKHTSNNLSLNQQKSQASQKSQMLAKRYKHDLNSTLSRSLQQKFQTINNTGTKQGDPSRNSDANEKKESLKFKILTQRSKDARSPKSFDRDTEESALYQRLKDNLLSRQQDKVSQKSSIEKAKKVAIQNLGIPRQSNKFLRYVPQINSHRPKNRSPLYKAQPKLVGKKDSELQLDDQRLSALNRQVKRKSIGQMNNQIYNTNQPVIRNEPKPIEPIPQPEEVINDPDEYFRQELLRDTNQIFELRNTQQDKNSNRSQSTKRGTQKGQGNHRVKFSNMDSNQPQLDSQATDTQIPMTPHGSLLLFPNKPNQRPYQDPSTNQSFTKSPSRKSSKKCSRASSCSSRDSPYQQHVRNIKSPYAGNAVGKEIAYPLNLFK